MNEQQVEIPPDAAGSRLDRFLADQALGLSRSTIQRLIEAGQVRVNGRSARASYKIRTGDRITIERPEAEPEELAAEVIPLKIMYEDEALLAVDKPAGMVVHPAPGHRGGTLVNAILAHCPGLAAGVGDDRPGIVHRLDRDTSGLILVAKSEHVRRALQRQFQARQVQKLYLALLEGHLEASRGRIEAPVGRDPRHRQRMAVLPGGRDAVTEYRVTARFSQDLGPLAGRYTFVEAEPKTGRTHQIRVHFASIGHPVVGDTVYGRRRAGLPVRRQFLHAWRLGLQHPVTGERLDLEAALPEDLDAVLRLLGRIP